MDLLDLLLVMDREKSFAQLTITPIVRGKEKYYQCTDEVKIEPYPNPLHFGGMWGSNIVRTKEELERIKKEFLGFVERYKRLGLERIEIKEMPEVSYEEYMEQWERSRKLACPEIRDGQATLFNRL